MIFIIKGTLIPNILIFGYENYAPINKDKIWVICYHATKYIFSIITLSYNMCIPVTTTQFVVELLAESVSWL